MSSNSIFKSDNTAAFGGNFLTIKVKNPELYKVSKLLFVVNSGVIQKLFKGEDYNYFQQEETLLTVNFTSQETQKLSSANVGNLIAYDENNLQETCAQTVRFSAQNGVICNAKCRC